MAQSYNTPIFPESDHTFEQRDRIMALSNGDGAVLALTLYCAFCILFIVIMLVMEDCLINRCCPNNNAADGVGEVLAVHQVVSLQRVSEASHSAMVAADRLPKSGVFSNAIELSNAPRGSGNIQEGDEEEGNIAPAAQISVSYITRELN